MATEPTPIRPDLTEEATRLLAAARQRRLPVRVLGGIAIRLLLGDRLHERYRRPINDIDLITPRRHGSDVEGMLTDEGWQPERQFNALNGARRLLFNDPGSEHKIDVFVETFDMCHSLPLAARLDTHDETLPAAELLMTKLQIVELNDKDVDDALALLLALEIADHDRNAINAQRIASLTSRDWGLHHTLELNLANLHAHAGERAPDQHSEALINQRVEALQEALQAAPKTRAFKLRARIGERKRWHNEPEEIDRD